MSLARVARLAEHMQVEAGEMYFTYILLSSSKTKTYVGHTNDLKRRLEEHNSGRSTFTNRYKPWSIIYEECHSSENQAILKEKYFKSAAGRRWIKKHLFLPEW